MRSTTPSGQARARGVEPRGAALETACSPRSTLVFQFAATLLSVTQRTFITTRHGVHLFALDKRWGVMDRIRVDKFV